MKIQSRAVRVFVAALLTVNLAVAVSAKPRERERDVPPAISKILKKIQKFFAIVPLNDLPIPPRP